MTELNMNKRTKKIAMRAFDETTMATTKNTGEKISFAERFAELMVEECQVALDPLQEGLISRAEAYDLIKKHFAS